MKDEDCGFPIEEVSDRAACQRELLIAEEADDRGEVEAPLIPRLDVMHVATFYVERMLARKEAQVVGDRLGHHAGRPVALERPDLPVVDGDRDQQHGGRRQGRDYGRPPSSPPRGWGRSSSGPLRGEPALE